MYAYPYKKSNTKSIEFWYKLRLYQYLKKLYVVKHTVKFMPLIILSNSLVEPNQISTYILRQATLKMDKNYKKAKREFLIKLNNV